jgi:hypothetical protein
VAASKKGGAEGAVRRDMYFVVVGSKNGRGKMFRKKGKGRSRKEGRE